VTQPALLALFAKHQEKGKQAKLKSPAQLQEVGVGRTCACRADDAHVPMLADG